MNIEHTLIENENRQIEDDFEGLTKEESISHLFDADRIQTAMEAEATKQANKILKKNKREIRRLKTHAGNCLLTKNFEGYSYAIKKLRDFYKQPYTNDLILTMWNTSLKSIDDIIAKHSN